MREETRQRVLLHRFDFAAQLGQRLAPDQSQDLVIAPLAMQASRTETAFENAAVHCELVQGVLHYSGIEREAISCFAQRERTVSACIAANQFQHGLRHRIDERGGQARRKRNAEGITVAGGIFHGDEATLTGDAQFEQAARAQQAIQ